MIIAAPMTLGQTLEAKGVPDLCERMVERVSMGRTVVSITGSPRAWDTNLVMQGAIRHRPQNLTQCGAESHCDPLDLRLSIALDVIQIHGIVSV